MCRRSPVASSSRWLPVGALVQAGRLVAVRGQERDVLVGDDLLEHVGQVGVGALELAGHRDHLGVGA